MCGRYALSLPPHILQERLVKSGIPLQIQPSTEHHQPADQSAAGIGIDAGSSSCCCWGYRQSYNVPPGEVMPVLRSAPSGGLELPGGSSSGGGGDGVRYVLEGMKWGLTPPWTKKLIINRRDTSLGIRDRNELRNRCVVVVEGFYEWLNKKNGGGGGRGKKVPYYVKRKDGELMFLAGLWESCGDVNGGGRPDEAGSSKKPHTYAIITTTSCKKLSFLHNRMPVIFDNDSEALKSWLSPYKTTYLQSLRALLVPYAHADEGLVSYPVSNEVGNVGNDGVRLVLPVGIRAFFDVKKQEGTKEKEEKGLGEEAVKKEGVGESNVPLPAANGGKRGREDEDGGDAVQQRKVVKVEDSGAKSSRSTTTIRKSGKELVKGRGDDGKGNQKITRYFKK